MLLGCAIWRVDRLRNVLIAVLNDSRVALDFLQTKSIETLSHYYVRFYPLVREYVDV